MDLGSFLRAGDLLVLNDTRVVNCRIPCLRRGSHGAMEVFLLDPPAEPVRKFRAFFKPARRAKAGHIYEPLLGDHAGAFRILEQHGEQGGLVEWIGEKALGPSQLQGLGVVPLPPYIKRDRIPSAETADSDATYYQSVYATKDGSAAAPTAGLHFTSGMIDRLKKQGIDFATVTLHVGAGTFLPVKSENLDDHVMHSERFELSAETADRIKRTKMKGRRVIAVGTTSVRVLENLPALSGNTDIFIKPGYRFKYTDALITNFHQPRSTLIALVGAFCGLPRILDVYHECLEKKYRFLSYGDAMFIQ